MILRRKTITNCNNCGGHIEEYDQHFKCWRCAYCWQLRPEPVLIPILLVFCTTALALYLFHIAWYYFKG